MGEIIRIEVLAIDGPEIVYRDVVSRARGRATGEIPVPVGGEALIEVDTVKGRRVIARVLEPAPELRLDDLAPPPAEGDPPPVLLDGSPLEPDPADAEVVVGQVRTAVVAFRSHHTAERDRGRTSKRRPCVVVAIEGETVTVCPIHGGGTAVRRSGRGRRLDGWADAGLRKPSWVSAEQTVVGRASLGPLIGVLGSQDRRRLGL